MTGIGTGTRRLLGVGLVAGSTAALYRFALRPWQERWGATDEEVVLVLPGDDLVAEPASQITRAVTIDAPVEEVWPWVVQLGADRGGFASYDWLENLFGLGIHSTTDVVPDWQARAVGDFVAADRAGTGGWYVGLVDPPTVLALQLADLKAGRPARREDGLRWEFLWTFALRPTGDGRSRLLVRERAAFASDLTRRLMAPLGPASFVMTRKMLLGIKARAEGRAGRAAGGPLRAGA